MPSCTSASLAEAENSTSAALKWPITSMDVRLAFVIEARNQEPGTRSQWPRAIGTGVGLLPPGSLFLLPQIVLNMLRFPQQIRHVLVRGVGEPQQHLHIRVELLGELAMLLVPPGGIELGQLIGQCCRSIAQRTVELLQALGKLPQLFRIDDSLGHFRSPCSRASRPAVAIQCDCTADRPGPARSSIAGPACRA